MVCCSRFAVAWGAREATGRRTLSAAARFRGRFLLVSVGLLALLARPFCAAGGSLLLRLSGVRASAFGVLVPLRPLLLSVALSRCLAPTVLLGLRVEEVLTMMAVVVLFGDVVDCSFSHRLSSASAAALDATQAD